jgi:hypothetical protein
MNRRWIAILGLLFSLCVTPAHAQEFIVRAGDSVAWDQLATTIAEAQTMTFTLVLDGQTQIPLTGVACSQPAGISGFPCRAPLPAAALGTHTLVLLTTLNGVTSAASAPPITIRLETTTPPPTVDPKCVFPTGNSAVTIFVTRYQVAALKATLYFQLGQSISPVNEISLFLRPTSGPDVPAAPPIKGERLDDVGAAWFTMPTSGIYRVGITVKNAAGCSATIITNNTISR